MGLYLNSYDIVLAISGKALERVVQTFVLEQIAASGLPLQILFGESALEIGMPVVELLPKYRLTPLGQIIPDDQLIPESYRIVPENAIVFDFPFTHMNLELDSPGSEAIECADGTLSLMLTLGFVASDGNDPATLGFALDQAEVWLTFSSNSPGVIVQQVMERRLREAVSNNQGDGNTGDIFPQVFGSLLGQLNTLFPGKPSCPIRLDDTNDNPIHPMTSTPTELLCTDFLIEDNDDRNERLLIIAARLSPLVAELPFANNDTIDTLDLSWRQPGEEVSLVISNRFILEDLLPPGIASALLQTHHNNQNLLAEQADLQAAEDDEDDEDEDSTLSWNDRVSLHFDQANTIIENIPYRFDGLPYQAESQTDEDLPEDYVETNGFIEAFDFALASTLHPISQSIVNAIRLQITISGSVPQDGLFPGYDFSGWVAIFLSFKASDGKLVPDIWADTTHGLQVDIANIITLPPEILSPFISAPLSDALKGLGNINPPLPMPLLFNNVIWDDLILSGIFDYRSFFNSVLAEPRRHDLIGNANAGTYNIWLRLDANPDALDSETQGDNEVPDRDARWRIAGTRSLTNDAVFRFSLQELATVNNATAAYLGDYPLWQAYNLGLIDTQRASLNYEPLTIGPPTINLSYARAIALRSETGRYSLLLLINYGSYIQCFYRRYPQLLRDENFVISLKRDYQLNQGAYVDTITLPIIIPGGTRIEERNYNLVYGRESIRTTGRFDAIFYRWIQPVDVQWRVVDRTGQTTILSPVNETVVQINGASVNFNVQGSDNNKSLAGAFGSRCVFETTLGSDGEFTIQMRATEPCIASPIWEASQTVTYVGERIYISGIDKSLDAINESLRNLYGGFGCGGFPPRINPERWKMVTGRGAAQSDDDETPIKFLASNRVEMPRLEINQWLDEQLDRTLSEYLLKPEGEKQLQEFRQQLNRSINSFPASYNMKPSVTPKQAKWVLTMVIAGLTLCVMAVLFF